MSGRLLVVSALLLLGTACSRRAIVDGVVDTGWSTGCLDLAPSDVVLEVLRPGESDSAVVTAENGCGGWLWISDLFLEGRDSDRFDVVGDTEAELSPGEGIEVEVVFAPEEDGVWEAALWVESNAAWTEETWVSLTGRTLADGNW